MRGSDDTARTLQTPHIEMNKPHPTELRRLPESGLLRIIWSDGHTAEYGYDYLRGYCPCAGCQGHTSAAVRFQKPELSVEPITIRPVGNYAVSFHWSDAHATGIYRFDFLREICPCTACVAERSAAGGGAPTDEETT